MKTIFEAAGGLVAIAAMIVLQGAIWSLPLGVALWILGII